MKARSVLVLPGRYVAVTFVLGVLVKCQALSELGIFSSEQNNLFF